MSDQPKDALSSVLEKNAKVVIKHDGSQGGLAPSEILAWRRWFDERRGKVTSSGGRPTNPDWTVKRQVSFSSEVWEYLKDRAAACSEDGPKIGPGQVAGLLLEDVVQLQGGPQATEDQERFDLDAELEAISDDPRFHEWKMPSLFSGSVH